MTSKSVAPFRAEHVGSFPRPERLLKARQDYFGQQISREEFKDIERVCIKDVVALQERIGIGP
jgi:methionine synthase II (cobalamin-independent)